MGSPNQASNKKTALITGASGGIGLELTRVFASEGYNLVLVARSEEKLNEVKADLEKRASITAKVIAKDLADPASPQQIFDQLQDEGTQVDVLVNNAGFTVYGRFTETEAQKEQDLLQVNIIALTHLAKLFIPGMVERGWGKVLNLASVAAFMPGPLMACYYASKAYVLSFSEAIGKELEGTGVTVTALCPGPTESGFQARGNMEESKIVAGRKLPTARSVARSGYRALMKGQSVAFPDFSNWAVAASIRLTPRKLVLNMVERAQERV